MTPERVNRIVETLAWGVVLSFVGLMAWKAWEVMR